MSVKPKLKVRLILRILNGLVILSLLVGIVYLLIEKKQTADVFQRSILTSEYLAKDIPADFWQNDGGNAVQIMPNYEKKNYVQFVSSDQTDRKIIWETKYELIGNGVFQLGENEGFLVTSPTGLLQVKLKKVHPLIFEEYMVKK
ncbi:hypothetical protein [Enterococcus timonensis]|uniref:hypothetical protein n=1 Tax=Enterococcus timonensis TaxID=1852364 RepID=UPI0008D9E454|nr:hypothetical protein [Enterococcus timonensis]